MIRIPNARRLLASGTIVCAALAATALAAPHHLRSAALGDGLSPVVLLHGWHGSGTGNVEDTSLATLARRLSNDGHPVYWASGVGSSRTGTVYDRAEELGAIISEVSRSHDGAEVAVIAHSYGGIVARALVESDLYDEVLVSGGRVSSVVALGAPMAGVDMWLPFVFVLGDPRSEPSVWELTPSYMSAFNLAHRPNPDVRYTFIVGDVRQQSWLLRLLPPSDGVVSVASAHALCGECYGIWEPVTDDFHGQHSLAQTLGLRSYLESRSTYLDVIRPAIVGGAVAGNRGVGRPDASRPDVGSPDVADVNLGSLARSLGSRPHSATYERPHYLHTPIGQLDVARGSTVSFASVLGSRGVLTAMDETESKTGQDVDVDVRTERIALDPLLPFAPIELRLLRDDLKRRSGVTSGGAADGSDSSDGTGPETTRLSTMSLVDSSDDGFRLQAEAAPGSLQVTVSAARSSGSSVWAELVWPVGSRKLVLRENVDSIDYANSASAILSESLLLDPGYYLVRAGYNSELGPVETEQDVVVPYANDDRPAKLVAATIAGNSATVSLDVAEPGRFVVAVAPRTEADHAGRRLTGSSVRMLPAGRSEVVVRLLAPISHSDSDDGADSAPASAELLVRLYRAETQLMLADVATLVRAIPGEPVSP